MILECVYTKTVKSLPVMSAPNPLATALRAKGDMYSGSAASCRQCSTMELATLCILSSVASFKIDNRVKT